jgi:hypothetical protein
LPRNKFIYAEAASRLGLIQALRPALRKNFLLPQARLDQFIRTFNEEPSHEALNMRYPTEIHSSR